MNLFFSIYIYVLFYNIFLYFFLIYIYIKMHHCRFKSRRTWASAFVTRWRRHFRFGITRKQRMFETSALLVDMVRERKTTTTACLNKKKNALSPTVKLLSAVYLRLAFLQDTTCIVFSRGNTVRQNDTNEHVKYVCFCVLSSTEWCGVTVRLAAELTSCWKHLSEQVGLFFLSLNI